MVRAIKIDFEKEAKKKQEELEKIGQARRLMREGKLRDASLLLYDIIYESYGKVCVRNWLFRQYALLSEDNAPTELGRAVDEFLALREKQQAWWA